MAKRTKITLLPFQRKSVDIMKNKFNGRVLLADEMGLGKTIQSLSFCKETRGSAPVIVVCPSIVKMNWVRESLAVLGVRPIVLDGQTASTIHIVNPKRTVIVLNYDIVQYWTEELLRLKPQTLILDECHNLISAETKQTIACKAIAKKTRYVLALSGTPMTNRPKDLFPVVNMVCPKAFPSFGKFAQKYCAPKLTIWGWNYNGASRVTELNRRLRRTCMIRRLFRDVMHELPKRKRHVVSVSLRDPRSYKAAEENFVGWLKKQDPAKAKKAEKGGGLSKLTGLKMEASRQKVPALVSWINDWLEQHPDEKLVVFGYHKKMLNALERRINARLVRVDGGTSKAEKHRAVEQFQKNKSTRVFLGNLKAAGTGTDGLQKAASTLVICELTYSPKDIFQGEGRVDRLGQTKDVNIYYLIARGTVEMKLCKLLRDKQKVITSVLDGNRIDADFDIAGKLLDAYA